jgi:branched-chain amino acid transport system ATP-binding protein
MSAGTDATGDRRDLPGATGTAAPATDQAEGLAMEHVTAGYLANDVVLEDVTIRAKPGRVTAVLGPNGSGKSTALRVMYGFLAPRSGRVSLDGRDVTGLAVHERLAAGISFLPQGRSVFPQLTVEENLRLGAWRLRRHQAELRAAVDRMLERYPILARLRGREAGSLSGGQARLLEFGGTLILDPAVVLVDEPSVGLAPVLVDEVYQELARLKDERRTVLLVDQNVQAAVELADHVYTLAYGRNHMEGARDEFTGRLDELIKAWLRL